LFSSGNRQEKGESMSSGAAESERRYAPVGKFEPIEHIAKGGMAQIYKAVNRETGEVVVLKVLLPELAAKPGSLERFRREASRGVNLRHENLVAIYEFGEERGYYFLVLEYVQGTDLQEYITRKGRLSPEEAFEFLTQAARALDYLHRQDVVHRDIKPSNFLVAETETQAVLKLTDLGLAREIKDEEFRITRAGFTVGTINYMAPEQARDSGQADIRSDLYSLGCTFYHMLTGQAPFDEGGLTERLYKHAEAEPTDVRQFNPDVSPALVAILKRLLAKKPSDRYQTPAKLLKDLALVRDASAQASTVHAPPAPEPEPEPEPEEDSTPLALPTYPGGQRLESVPVERRVAAAKLFKRAGQLNAAQDYEGGVEFLQRCCKLDPAALTYRQALREFQKKKYPDRASVNWLARARVLPAKVRLLAAKQGEEGEKVLEHGEAVLAHNPWDLGTHLDMAAAAEALGLRKLAVWLLEQLWQPDAHTPALNRALARLYEKQGNFKEAATLLNLLLEADPGDLDAQSQLRNLAARETIARAQFGQATRKQDEKPEE
jgi:serine/threonine protein kinase